MLKGMPFTVGVGTRPLPTPAFKVPTLHQSQSHVHRALPQDRVDGNNNYAPQRVFMFDPSNPSSVEELMVEPHQDTAAAEELLAAAEQHAQAVTELTGRGSSPNATAAVKRTPIPLRSVSPMPSRNRSSISGRLGAMQQSQSLVPMNGRDSAMTAKSAEMQKQLVSQLEKEQTQVAHLQQYEVLYKEWRMKAERLDSDIGLLQRLVAEKDAELAHGYKLLESSAAERSRLRHSFLASQEKAKQLQAQLAQAEAKALTAGPPQGLLGSGSHDMSNGHGNGNGRGRSNGNGSGATLNMTSMQGMIEELSMLAKGLAQDMSLEVTTVANMPGRRDS